MGRAADFANGSSPSPQRGHNVAARDGGGTSGPIDRPANAGEIGEQEIDVPLTAESPRRARTI